MKEVPEFTRKRQWFSEWFLRKWVSTISLGHWAFHYSRDSGKSMIVFEDSNWYLLPFVRRWVRRHPRRSRNRRSVDSRLRLVLLNVSRTRILLRKIEGLKTNAWTRDFTTTRSASLSPVSEDNFLLTKKRQSISIAFEWHATEGRELRQISLSLFRV